MHATDAQLASLLKRANLIRPLLGPKLSAPLQLGDFLAPGQSAFTQPNSNFVRWPCSPVDHAFLCLARDNV